MSKEKNNDPFKEMRDNLTKRINEKYIEANNLIDAIEQSYHMTQKENHHTVEQTEIEGEPFDELDDIKRLQKKFNIPSKVKPLEEKVEEENNKPQKMSWWKRVALIATLNAAVLFAGVGGGLIASLAYDPNYILTEAEIKQYNQGILDNVQNALANNDKVKATQEMYTNADGLIHSLFETNDHYYFIQDNSFVEPENTKFTLYRIDLITRKTPKKLYEFYKQVEITKITKARYGNFIHLLDKEGNKNIIYRGKFLKEPAEEFREQVDRLYEQQD